MSSEIKKPNWLIEIENNSWNPELLISGLSIVFVFAISDEVNDLGIFLVQRFGINPILVFFLILYLNFAITTLKITFATHLFLRGVWIGLVGLNYTFPKGINKQKLSKIQSQDFLLQEIKEPVDRILSLEKICSSIFSLAFSIVGISIFIILIIVFASVLNLIGLSLTQAGIIIAVVFVFMIIPPFIIYYSNKFFKIEDIPLLRKAYVLFTRFTKLIISSESLVVFITNVNRYALMITFYIYSMLMGAYGGRLSERYNKFSNGLIPQSESSVSWLRKKSNKSPKSEWFSQEYYGSNHRNGKLIQNAVIDNYINHREQLEIFIPEFKWDHILLDSLQTETPNMRKTDLLNSMLTVTVDSSYIPELNWMKTTHKVTQQKGWITFLNTTHLNKGKHEIRISKVIWNFSSEKIELHDNWARFDFYQER